MLLTGLHLIIALIRRTSGQSLRISKFSDVEKHLNIWPIYTFRGLKNKSGSSLVCTKHTYKQKKTKTLQYLVSPFLIFLCFPHDQ